MVCGITIGVARGRVIEQLSTNLKDIAQAFFEMLPIAQHRFIGDGAIWLGKARASSELGGWRLEEAETCPELKAWEDRT